ncbi:MAG: NAD-dependent epimerase/dehydratase family protein [Rickettsiales bacterium]
MKILITGVAGFIGSNLAEKLISNKNLIFGIDNFDNFYSKNIKIKNISNLIKNPNFKFFELDILDNEKLNNLFIENKFDIVIHLAAKAGVLNSWEDPVGYYNVNVIGLINILESLKKHRINKFIFASSSSVYGNTSAQIFKEDIVDLKPISPYASSKLAGEKLCELYANSFDIKTICLRFFTVFGPRQRPDLVINKFITLINEDKPITIYGDGQTIRDYTYIDDIIDGIVEAINYNSQKFEIFNLGGGCPVKLIELINILKDKIKKDIKINYSSIPNGDMLRTSACIKKSLMHLKYRPKINFEKGIENYLQWRLNENI